MSVEALRQGQVRPGEISLREIEAVRQNECPDPVRFPPPHNGADVYSDDNSGNSGGIKLQILWQPCWDTQPIERHRGTVNFFQNVQGKPHSVTNLSTSGSLSWPKRFHAWEIVLQFGCRGIARFVPEFIKETERLCGLFVDDAVLIFRVGEKNAFTTPLNMMYQPKPGHFRAALTKPIYIPPVQNFLIALDLGREYKGNEHTAIRCMMNGYLLREIQ